MSTERVPPIRASRPRVLAEDDAVVIDGEVVVYAAGEVHRLNSTAALIWQGCDGGRSLDELATQLAETFQADPATVLRDVVAVAGSLADRSLIAFDDDRRPEGDTKPVLLPEPTCSGCGNGPDYDVQILVDVGSAAIAVGADASAAEQIAAAFGDRVLGRADARVGRASYGVVLPGALDGRVPQPVARLHRGPDILFRSRDPERVLRALVAQVSTHSVPAGHLRLEAVAVGDARGAVLVPVPENRVAYQRRAGAFGLSVSDAPVTLVGVDPPTVRVGSAWPDVDVASLRPPDRRPPSGNEPPPMPWGVHELRAIALSGPGTAAGVLGELGTDGDGERDDGRGLDDLVRLARSVPMLADPTPSAVAASLERAPHPDPV